MSNYVNKIIKLLIVSVLLFGCFWLLNNQQELRDKWRLRSYTPPSSISSIADSSGMSDYGRRLFYVSYPELKDRTSFRQFCTNSEQSIVLGCYISTQNIYLLDVIDERLSGVEQVTAAHEMLHAAYARLSAKDRKKVDKMVDEQLKTVNDKRILDTIESYRKSDPASVPNEMHSIFGSELANLNQDLEEYYLKYFSNRSKVTVLANSYAAEFTSREQHVEDYDVRLSSLKTQIDQKQASLKEQASGLESQHSELESRRGSLSAYEFNQLANQYNSSVRIYNGYLQDVKSLINQYNTMVEQRNSIALEEQSLIEAIDTRVDIISK